MGDFHLRFGVKEDGTGWYTNLFDLLDKKEKPSPIEAVPSTGGHTSWERLTGRC